MIVWNRGLDLIPAFVIDNELRTHRDRIACKMIHVQD